MAPEREIDDDGSSGGGVGYIGFEIRCQLCAADIIKAWISQFCPILIGRLAMVVWFFITNIKWISVFYDHNSKWIA